jgi:hypothetical protein
MVDRGWTYGTGGEVSRYTGQIVVDGSTVVRADTNSSYVNGGIDLYQEVGSGVSTTHYKPTSPNVTFREVAPGYYQTIRGYYLYRNPFTNSGTIAGDIYVAGGPKNYDWNIDNTGKAFGISLPGGSVTNIGTVTGRTYIGYEAQAAHGTSPSGAVNNSGTMGYVKIYNGTIQNSGVILGGAVSGRGTIGDVVNITNTGTIDGGQYGVRLGGAAAITNFGVIQSQGTNGAGIGVQSVTAVDTIIDYGTIIGASGTAVQLASGGDLVVEPGAYLAGMLNGGGGGTLTLAGTDGYGVLSDGFTNFAEITVDSQDDWDLTANVTLTTLDDLGTLVAGGTLTNFGAVSLSGSDELVAKGVLVNYGTINVGSSSALVDDGTLIDNGAIYGEVTFGTASTSGALAAGPGPTSAQRPIESTGQVVFGYLKVGAGDQIVN